MKAIKRQELPVVRKIIIKDAMYMINIQYI